MDHCGICPCLHNLYTFFEFTQDMLRVNPVSLNAISYNAVIRALEIIRDGHAPISKPYKQQPKIMSSGDVIHNDKTVNTGSIIGTHKIMELEPPIVTDIFIDTVGDPSYYKSRLVQALGEDYGNFTIEKKADANYRVVSAASIIAKVTRDRLLKVSLTPCFNIRKPAIFLIFTFVSH